MANNKQLHNFILKQNLRTASSFGGICIRGILFALLNLSTMDYMKIFLSILLVLAFYILFDQESIEKLRKGGISISRNEAEQNNFKEPGKFQLKLYYFSLLMVLIWYKGMLFFIESGKNQHFFWENCVKKNISFEVFEACVGESIIKSPLIKSVGIQSFEKQLYLNSYKASEIIIPNNHSIGVKPDFNKPTFQLNPAYSFALVFFDKDYFLYVTNPLIVHRSMLKVSRMANPSVLMVGIEASNTLKKKTI